MVEAQTSIQESLYPTLTCFGCGHANPKGFHLRSYVKDADSSPKTVVASFTPRPEHDNGFGFLNGGIITTILDCHTAAAVLLEAHDRGWKAPDGAPIPFITAGFDVRFLRPTPLGPTVELRGKIVSAEEDVVIVLGELVFEAKVRATMQATWKRFRPRP